MSLPTLNQLLGIAMKRITMNDISENQLFICIGVGVLRKTHPCQGTDKAGKTYVIYPDEVVRELTSKIKS